MTEKERNEIQILQKRGYGYKRIAVITGIPINAVKSYTTRYPEEQKPVCLQCGKSLGPTQKLVFCSRLCKSRWWNAHPHMMKKQTLNSFTCPVCGKAFFDYGRRIYCSVACYAEARRKKNA